VGVLAISLAPLPPADCDAPATRNARWDPIAGAPKLSQNAAQIRRGYKLQQPPEDGQIMAQSRTSREKADSGIEPQQVIKDNGNRRKMSRRRVLALAAVGLAVVGLAVGISCYLYAISHESTDDAFIDGHIIAVSPRVSGHVARVYVTDNQQVAAGDLLVELDPRDFQARLDAARAALDAAEAARRSHDIDVRLTSITSAAGLNEAEQAVAAAEAMVKNARALAAAAKGQQGEAKAQVAFAKAALDQARAEAHAVEAKYQESALDLKRYQEMARSKSISPQQLDHAVTDERMAAADLNAARSKVATQQSLLNRAEAALTAADENVHQAEAQAAARQAQLEQAKARLTSAQSAPVQVAQSNSRAEASKADAEKARAEVAQAELNLSYTKIYAPAAGHVTRKNVEPGVFVQVGQSLMAIVPPKVWVTANFKETQLTHMRPGQPVTVSVDTYPNQTFHGRVDSIQRGTGARFSLLPPENATGNFVKVVQRIPVKIVFDRPEELAKYLLVPGMSVVPEVNVKVDVPAVAAGKDAKKDEIRSAMR
jgi:membrane fusion protein (multidrug efflux system)